MKKLRKSTTDSITNHQPSTKHSFKFLLLQYLMKTQMQDDLQQQTSMQNSSNDSAKVCYQDHHRN